MLREMDFVESDWAALFWALGSATALFKHLEAPMSDPSAVFSRMQALRKKIRRRTLAGYAACFIGIVGLRSSMFTFHNTLQRVGSRLSVAATLYMAYLLYDRRNRSLPSELHPAACADFYRAELARQRDLYRGIWLWSRLVIGFSSYILFLIGVAMPYPGLAGGLAIFAACFLSLCVVAIPLNLRISRKYQRQMDELDALPKES
jgi:hypothetical protein